MAAYVDDLLSWPVSAYRGDRQAERVGARNGHRWCHLWADTEEQLHRIARLIGMKRDWAHRSRRGVLHYNLTPSSRQEAVLLGARELTRHEAVVLLARLRAGRAA